jgi:hypothetical protein
VSKWQLIIDLVRSGECTASCLFGMDADGKCTCRCGGKNHGLAEKINDLNGSENPLIGKFFHSTSLEQDGCEVIEWQGIVLGAVDSATYLVGLFNFFDGGMNVQHIVKLDAMGSWHFYEDNEDMMYAYTHGHLGHVSKHHVQHVTEK